MAKQIEHSEEARKQLMEGFDILARAVGVTRGPMGRNVILGKDFGPPQVCSDGVTIAKEIELKEPFQNMGAQLLKEAASKTNDSVGDGTTTSTILAQNMVRQGFRNIAAGSNPMALKKGIDKAVTALKVEIEAMAQPVQGRTQIAQVAILAAHDEEMGNLLADVMEKIGSHGVITIEESKGLSYEVDYIEGMQIDRGFISPYFVTNAEKMMTEMEDPYILITTEKISSMADLLPVLEKLTPVSRNFVVIAEDVDGEALATLVVNKLRGNLNCLAVKAPGFGERRKAILDDMAVLFNATVISGDIGRKLDSVEISDLGRCRKIIATKDITTFVEGAGEQTAIDARIKQLKTQAEDTSSDYDREKLEERAAKLAGGVAVIKVGAFTEVELREKKQRLEDSLSATRAAMDEGIVPGGGTSLVRAAQAAVGKIQVEGDERIGAQIAFDAVEGPLKLIMENAGLAGDVVLAGVKKGEGDYGFDAETEQYGAMLEMGIIDPAKVTRAALENAASVAGMVLTTESIMTELNPMKLPAPFND